MKPGGDSRALGPEARATGRDGTDDKTPPTRPARAVVFRDTDQPGSYRVRAFRNNGAWVDRPDETFVVNLDTRESDPAVLPLERRPDHVAAKMGPQGHAPIRHLELWHVIGAALIAFLLLESILTLRLRAHRARPTAEV